jgi:hypothetical protein
MLFLLGLYVGFSLGHGLTFAIWREHCEQRRSVRLMLLDVSIASVAWPYVFWRTLSR